MKKHGRDEMSAWEGEQHRTTDYRRLLLCPCSPEAMVRSWRLTAVFHRVSWYVRTQGGHYHLTTEELPQGSIKSLYWNMSMSSTRGVPKHTVAHSYTSSQFRFIFTKICMYEIWVLHLMIGMGAVLMHLLSLFSAKQNQQSPSDILKFFFSSSSTFFAP